MKDLPLVVILATGGTIAGRGSSPLSFIDYEPASLAGDDLLNAVPAIRRFARVSVEQICNVASINMNFSYWRTLAARIDALFTELPGLAGIVITHGTSTIEETAYFLNLTIRHSRPVVLVGAQRPVTALSSDGPINLVNAVRTATCADSSDRGVLVVMNEEINAARDVTKSSTYRLEAFRSGELGFLGYVDQDRIAYYRRPDKRHTTKSEFDWAIASSLPAVDIVYPSVASNSYVVVNALRQAGAQGIVFAAHGAGILSDADVQVVKHSRARGHKTVFVRSTRVANGRVISRSDYDDLGVIPADNLSPQKARILLMFALAKSHDLGTIRRIFEEY